jgi:prepilin-type N-terminal cleavage/methylation domain-containing protein
MRTERQNEQAGFTLVELLVVLVIFGILSGILYAALRDGSMALSRTSAHQNDISSLAVTEQVLSRSIQRMYPEFVPAELEGMPGKVDFDGEPNSMSFLTQAPSSIASGGMVRMALWLHQHGSSTALAVAAQPELSWRGQNNITIETLVTGISTASFAYWGSDNPGDPGYWHASWRYRPVLPGLIRLTIQFLPGDPRNWPDFLVAPMVYTDEACQFVPSTQSCSRR